MPVICPEGLKLSCYLPREDVRDSFISTKYKNINELPKGATVGTSSLRRRAQLLNKRPDLKIVEFRVMFKQDYVNLMRGLLKQLSWPVRV